MTSTLISQILDNLSLLPQLEREVIIHRFGLEPGGSGQQRSMREVSNHLHLDLDVVDETETRALILLRGHAIPTVAEEEEEDEEITECPLCGSGLEVRGKVMAYSEVASVQDGYIEYAGTTDYDDEFDEECDAEGNIIVFCSTCDWQTIAE